MFALTSPLPLGAAPAVSNEAMAIGRPGVGATGSVAVPGGAVRRGANWIETRPMVLNCAPAVDDETTLHRREPDLLLD